MAATRPHHLVTQEDQGIQKSALKTFFKTLDFTTSFILESRINLQRKDEELLQFNKDELQIFENGDECLT